MCLSHLVEDLFYTTAILCRLFTSALRCTPVSCWETQLYQRVSFKDQIAQKNRNHFNHNSERHSHFKCFSNLCLTPHEFWKSVLVGLSSDTELYCPRYGVTVSLIQFSFLDSTFLHAHTCIHTHTQRRYLHSFSPDLFSLRLSSQLPFCVFLPLH